MATSKTLTPTNVTIQIPAFTDKPDQRVNSNCIDKEADAINALSDQMAKWQLDGSVISSFSVYLTGDGRLAIALSYPTGTTRDRITQLIFAPTYIRVDSVVSGTAQQKTVNLS